MKVVKGFIGQGSTGRKMWGDVAERICLEEREVASKGEILEDIVGALLACADGFGLSCDQGLV